MWLTKFRNRSIKRELAVSLYVGALILWLAILIGSYYTIRHEVDELYDGELSQLARVLMTLYASDDIETQARVNGTLVTAPPFEGDDNYENKLLFQIWGNNKTLLVRSSNAPETPIAKKLEQHELNQFDTLKLFGNKTRVFTLWIPQVPFVVHVGQKIELRSEIASEILESFYIMILLVLPLLLLVIHKSINKGLKPLNHIASELSRRTSDNLNPLSMTNVPLEIQSITTSLNHLFKRLKNAFSRERQFIADAAHELRTPLAGLKAQAQIALADKSRVDKSLSRIVEGVDRTSRLADQLLSLSRLEAGQVEILKENVIINEVITEVCNDLAAYIEEKDIDVNIQHKQDVLIEGDRNMIYMLIRNLLENSIRYSPNHAMVKIILEKHDNNPTLQIIDNGPGIPENNLKRVFDRFYRDINTKASGSGLGLAIVKRITDLHKIELSIENRKQSSGLRVSLNF